MGRNLGFAVDAARIPLIYEQDIMQMLLEYVSKANYGLVRAQYLDPDIMRCYFKCYQTLSRGQHPRDWQVHPGRCYIAVRVPRVTSFMGLTQYRDERVIDGQRPDRIRNIRNPEALLWNRLQGQGRS